MTSTGHSESSKKDACSLEERGACKKSFGVRPSETTQREKHTGKWPKVSSSTTFNSKALRHYLVKQSYGLTNLFDPFTGSFKSCGRNKVLQDDTTKRHSFPGQECNNAEIAVCKVAQHIPWNGSWEPRWGAAREEVT